MNNFQRHTIQQLKKLPRQGMADPNDPRYVASELKTIFDNLPEIKNLYKEYNAIIDNLTDSNTKLSMGLGKVIAIQEQYAKGLVDVVENITYLEEQNKALNKSFGLSSVSSQKFATSLRNIAIQGKIGTDKIFEYAANLKDLTSGFIAANKGGAAFKTNLLKGQQYMLNNLKVTEEAAEGYEYYATAYNESAVETLAIQEKMAKTISEATGMDSLQIQKQLTEEIGGLTADLQMRYSRIPGSLELAVLKSKALGLSLDKLNNAGENLLNIESSIGTELEYQLLSGQRLLTADNKSFTNAYRMATMQGDANKQADLMNHLLKTQGGVLEKNLFARKKAAELLGTDEATLARSIQKQKLITKLGAESLMSLKQGDMAAVTESLRAKGVKEEDIAKLLELSDTRTTAERSEDYLKSISENTKKSLEAAGIDVSKVSAEAAAGITKAEGLITQFATSLNAKLFGKMTIFGETAGALNAPMKTLLTAIPKLGNSITGLITKLEEVMTVKLATGEATTVIDVE